MLEHILICSKCAFWVAAYAGGMGRRRWLVGLVGFVAACSGAVPNVEGTTTGPATSEAPLVTSQSPAPTSSTTSTSITTITTTTTTTTAPPVATASPRPGVVAALEEHFDGEWAQANLVSAYVWVVGEGELFSHGGVLELYPASTQKLLTAVTALAVLPPEHHYVTSVAVDPETADLVLIAGGDPLLTAADLDRLAQSVKVAGIERIEDLIIDATWFSDDLRAPGWRDSQIPRFTGPLSTLIVDRNRHRTDQAFLDEPDLENGRMFLEALRGAGIAVGGSARLDTAPTGADPITSIASADRDALVARMLSESHNEIAESLVRSIGRHVSGTGSTIAGTEVVRDTVSMIGADYLGTVADGSGLSRADVVSSRDMVRLLLAVQDEEWYPTMYAALPVSGRSGTLSGRLTGPATAGRVVAKTGTLIGAVALAGYVTLADASEAVFAILINGDTANQSVGAIDEFATLLATAG